MSDGTELQILVVGRNTMAFSAAAMLLRSGGYVCIKCTSDQMASIADSFRIDAVLVAIDTIPTVRLLRALPRSISARTMVVVSDVPDVVRKIQPDASCISTREIGEGLVQMMDAAIARGLSNCSAMG